VDACKALLLDSRLSLVGSLFDTVEEDHWSSLAENLVIVFEQNRRSIKLMIWALRREIAGTAHVREKEFFMFVFSLVCVFRFMICFVWTALLPS
jgi:hypothetical protein